MEIKEGDIFITELERNFFGAFKILKKGKSFFEETDGDLLMIGVLDFIDEKRPEISDKKLQNVLCCNRFSMSNMYCIEYFTDNFKYNKIKEYKFLGNLPITDFENKLNFKLGSGREGLSEGFPLSGVVENHFGNNTFYEWRWENENQEFRQEVENERIKFEKRAEEYRKRQMKPKKMLDENTFWKIIQYIDWKNEDDEERMQPVIKFLSKKKVTEIKQFQETLTYKLFLLDTKEHAKNIGEFSFKNEDEHFSVDYFLYVRCCVIANGKSLFESVIESPKAMPKNMDFEPLLYLSSSAYELKMKKEFEYETGCDYETFSNIKGWK